MQFTAVDLPAPLSPTRATMAPPSTSSVSSSSATTARNCLRRRSTRTSGVAVTGGSPRPGRRAFGGSRERREPPLLRPGLSQRQGDGQQQQDALGDQLLRGREAREDQPVRQRADD